MASISFDELVKLVDRLTPQEQRQLTTHLLTRTRQRELSLEEKMALLRAAQIDVTVKVEPSIRREDWYGDDGR